MKNFESDRSFIENKFHKTDEEFNPYHRMAYRGWDCDCDTGLSEEEIHRGLENMYAANMNLPHPVAKAKAVKYVLDHVRIAVNEHDWFVGFDRLDRPVDFMTIDKWNGDIFGGDGILSDIGREKDTLARAGTLSIWPDYDHVVPEWDSILKLGFAGIRARAAKYRKQHEDNGTLTPPAAAIFDGIDIEYSAIIDIIDRFYHLASSSDNSKSEGIAKCLKDIRDGAPQNIYEAMQSIFIYFIISENVEHFQVRSLGNGLDNSLLPFYDADLKNGTYTREEIKELLAYFLMQWSAIGNFWGQPFYLGGTDSAGVSKYVRLSYDILDVYDEMGIYNPKIQLKINDNTPVELLNKAFDMVRRGHNSIVFCCEPGMIKAAMSYGATYDEALGMDIRGCYETGIRGNEVSTENESINAAKSIVYAFTNGFDSNVNRQIGLKTGSLSSFRTFDDFYSAVIRQLEYFIETTLRIVTSFEPYLSYINPSLMYTATIEKSMEKGLDAYQNGVKFNNGSFGLSGFATLVDSLMAVKSLVYDEKITDLEGYKKALDADWVGFEDLRSRALKCPHKYGINDELADSYAGALARMIALRINNRPNARGGVYKTMFHSAMQFVRQGEKTPATPDGRMAGEEMSKNASPVSGMDTQGVTALLSSAVKLEPTLFTETFCLDIMLHPSAAQGVEGLEAMRDLLTFYLKNGGMCIQFNIFDVKTLKDAQNNPQKYRNLQVRVCGWNVLWNNLSRSEQDSYIKRAENIR